MGCAGIAADLDLATSGNELILALLNADGTVQFRIVLQNDDGELSRWRILYFTDFNRSELLRGEIIDKIANGEFAIGPSRMIALQFGEIELVMSRY